MHPQDAAEPARSIDDRLGCSTIPFRAWDLPGAHVHLQLETRDIDDADRPAETGRAARYITALLHSA